MRLVETRLCTVLEARSVLAVRIRIEPSSSDLFIVTALQCHSAIIILFFFIFSIHFCTSNKIFIFNGIFRREREMQKKKINNKQKMNSQSIKIVEGWRHRQGRVRVDRLGSARLGARTAVSGCNWPHPRSRSIIGEREGPRNYRCRPRLMLSRQGFLLLMYTQTKIQLKFNFCNFNNFFFCRDFFLFLQETDPNPGLVRLSPNGKIRTIIDVGRFRCLVERFYNCWYIVGRKN